jgi:hypothetical protein
VRTTSSIARVCKYTGDHPCATLCPPCRPGVCVRLFSRLQWEALAEHQLPEFRRSPLEPLCLQARAAPALAQFGVYSAREQLRWCH